MTPAALSIAPPRAIATKLFGTIEVESDQVVHTPEGVLGFPACREWVLLDGARPGTAWLQSAEHGALAFLLADPFTAYEGYAVDLSSKELERLGASETSDIAVFAIVTLPAREGEPATANLAAPVVVDVGARRAAQVIISDGRWSVKAPLAPSALS
ncbi:MAG: flagellar assembly protein FliW [Gemmatimonadetes bacterium]|nr:flagellar assembly protein FliW [Gemmatimonadota bacterium]